MPAFIQLVEFQASASEVEAVTDALVQFRAEHPDVITALTTRITEDKDRPGTYVAVNEFESYESAMAQSDHPATSEFAQAVEGKMAGRQFRNLVVIRDLPRP